MSFLGDLFNGANNAAAAQTQGIQQGLNAATGNINTANADLSQNYSAALNPFFQNYAQSNSGTSAYGNALGLNGPAGTQSALTQFQATPGYQAQIGAANNGANAAAAASGTLNSGNQKIALSNLDSGIAQQGFNNYVGQLSPYLGQANTAASGIGGVYTGLGQGLSSNENTLATLNTNAYTGIGNANASADLANQSLGMNLLGGGLNLAGSLFSDARLKEDIEPVGELFDGQSIYRYKYIDDPLTTHIGVMAQETDPGAVTDIGGFLAVDYGKATNMAADLGRFLEAA